MPTEGTWKMIESGPGPIVRDGMIQSFIWCGIPKKRDGKIALDTLPANRSARIKIVEVQDCSCNEGPK